MVCLSVTKSPLSLLWLTVTCVLPSTSKVRSGPRTDTPVLRNQSFTTLPPFFNLNCTTTEVKKHHSSSFLSGDNSVIRHAVKVMGRTYSVFREITRQAMYA